MGRICIPALQELTDGEQQLLPDGRGDGVRKRARDGVHSSLGLGSGCLARMWGLESVTPITVWNSPSHLLGSDLCFEVKCLHHCTNLTAGVLLWLGLARRTSCNVTPTPVQAARAARSPCPRPPSVPPPPGPPGDPASKRAAPARDGDGGCGLKCVANTWVLGGRSRACDLLQTLP